MTDISLISYLVFTAGVIAGVIISATIFVIAIYRHQTKKATTPGHTDVSIWLDASGSLHGDDSVIAGALGEIERIQDRARTEHVEFTLSVHAFSHMLSLQNTFLTISPSDDDLDLLALVPALREIQTSVHGGTDIELVYKNTAPEHEAVVVTDLGFAIERDTLTACDIERVAYCDVMPPNARLFPNPFAGEAQPVIRTASQKYLPVLTEMERQSSAR